MVFHIIVCEAYNVNAGAALVLGNLICAQIAIYGSATIVGAPIAAALGSVCAVMNTSLALSCSILPKLADDLCANSAFKNSV
jgi:hypothetical protein